MNPRLVVRRAALAALCLVPRVAEPSLAAAPPACAQDLAGLDRTLRADYAGFVLEITGARRAAFDRMLATERARAVGATGDACLAVLQAYTDFFDDPHVFIYQSMRIDSDETARRARHAEHVGLTETAARAYFATHRATLDPIEGIWYDDGLRIAIVRDSTMPAPTFVAVVLTPDTSIWSPGMVRGRFTRARGGGYGGYLWERNFARRIVRPAIYKRRLMRLNPEVWGKAAPIAPDDSGLVDPVEPHRATLVERDGATVLSIPSHDPTYQPWFDSLLASHRDLLMHTDRLIVDLRGNEGGSSRMTAAVLPYLVTDSERPTRLPDRSGYLDWSRALMRSSPDQIDYAIQHIMGGDTTDPGAARFLARLRAHPGGFAPILDSAGPPRHDPPVVPLYGPRRVGILIDHGTVSAAEAFLVEVMSSTRVTTYGEATAGALDYQNVTLVPMRPDEHRWYLGYPTITARPGLPKNGVRGKGIPPDVPLDLEHTSDPIARVAALLSAPPPARAGAHGGAPNGSSMFRGGPAHAGVSSARYFDGQGGVGRSWATNGAVRSSPAVTETRIFVGSDDDSLYAIDRARGTVAWRFGAGGPVSSSAAVAGGLVVAGTLGGRIFAVDERTGRLRWSTQSGPPLPRSRSISTRHSTRTRRRPTDDWRRSTSTHSATPS